MSYILDALRRADAERERGVVPGLHAQPDIPELEPAGGNRKPLLLAAAGGGALLVVLIALFVLAPWRGAPAGGSHGATSGEDAGETPSRSAATPAASRPPSPAIAATPTDGVPVAPANPGIATLAPDGSLRPAPLAPPAQAGVDEAPSARRSAGAMPSERAAPVRAAPAEPRPAATARAPSTRDAGTPDAAAPGVSRAPVADPNAAANGLPSPGSQAAAPAGEAVEHYGPPLANKAAPAAATAAAPPVKFNDLPPAVRAQIPRLGVGGAIYSDSPAGRMLILNGQIYHEGDHPTPDTLVEQIRLKSAVLSFRGMRYEITY